jgi:hypothetical protein
MVTLEDLKAWIGLPLTDEYDELLERLETEAVSYFEGRSGRHLGAPTTITEYHSGGAGGRQTMFAANAIASVVSIESRSSLAGDWVLADPADFEVIDRRIISKLGDLPTGTSNLRVIYKAGYKAGDEPGWLTRAVKGLVEHWFRSRVTATGGLSPSPEQEGLAVPEPVENAVRLLRTLPGA